MEKIFSYNVDIDKTAYMNWRTRQHQPIHDMMIIADGYMKAAMLLNMKESFCGGHDIRQIWNTVKKRMIGFETDKEQRKQFKEMTKELDDYILELYDKIDKDHNANAKMKNMDFSRYPFNADDEYHFYIENYGNEVVDLEMFVEIFKKIGDNLNCIAGYYEEMATFVPDYDREKE